MSQKEQWLEIVVLIICDRLPLFILEKWFKVFYYEVETVEIIFETNQIGLVGWIKRKVLSAPFTRTNNSGKVTHRRLCVIRSPSRVVTPGWLRTMQLRPRLLFCPELGTGNVLMLAASRGTLVTHPHTDYRVDYSQRSLSALRSDLSKLILSLIFPNLSMQWCLYICSKTQ